MKHRPKPAVPIPRRPRLVPRGPGDKVPVIRIGQRHLWFSDLYVKMLSMSWEGMLITIAALYFFSNLVFADMYYLARGGIENARPGSYADMFFFSVQTMATIGYGRLVPTSYFTNVVVTVEALWGFTFFAFVTGLAFAKFSRPTARVLFSDIAVISDYEGSPHLKIRMANQRTNRIVDVNVTLFLLRTGMTKEGFSIRRFYDLPLVRSHVPLLQITWTALHPIDENSPLYGITQEKLRENEDEIIIAISGHDETLSQTIHARHSYVDDEIICNSYFEDVLRRRDDGSVEVNYNLFHTTRAVGERK
jgi:inward rectifier potassium channel